MAPTSFAVTTGASMVLPKQINIHCQELICLIILVTLIFSVPSIWPLHGYWQIRVHHNSIEKTAFIKPQGLFEFQVMPFGLSNALSVFQRLMQQLLQGLNTEQGSDFVSVYIDDVLVFHPLSLSICNTIRW